MMSRRILILGIVFAACVACLFLGACSEENQGDGELTLREYPEVFAQDTIIVIGEYAPQCELEIMAGILAHLEEFTGTGPTVMSDAEALPEERRGRNLIVVGSPGSNQVLSEIYDKGYATEVTVDFPGPNKGFLEILVNPWDQQKALLIIAGSDDQGVTASAGVLTNNEEMAGFDDAMMMVVNPQAEDYSGLLGKAATEGHVLVITGLNLSTGLFRPEGTLDPTGVQRQRQAIAMARQALVDSLAGYDVVVYASWDSVPYVGLKVGLEALQHLIDSPYVTSIQEDSLSEPTGTLDSTT